MAFTLWSLFSGQTPTNEKGLCSMFQRIRCIHKWIATGFSVRWPVLFAGAVCALTANAVAAEESPGSGQPHGRPGITYEFSLAPFYQPSADINGGGEFSLSSAFVRAKISLPVSRAKSLGLQLKYDVDDYDFKGITEFGGLAPWNDARRFGIGLPLFARLENNWSLGFSPSVDWLQERGADNGDSFSYGATVFALKSIARGKSIGLGAGVFRQIDDDTDVFPFIAVDWRFNEKWRVSNPFDADVLGPAGLEISYSFSDKWHLGGGGVYRSFRFRLDDEGVAPNGIGENKGIAGFLRLRRSGGSGIDLDLFVGATFEGELELRDQNGAEIASSDYDTAPFVALALSGEF